MARYYRKKGFVVGCEDEATFGLLPIIKRGWARRGSKPIVTINSKNVCTNVFGARSKRSFVFSFAKRKRQKDFVRFAIKLLKRWNKVFLFVDKGPCHHGKIVDKFLNDHPETFRLEFFPSYSPDLNPQEQCWKPARKKLSNRFLPSLESMKYHLSSEFDDPSFMPKMFDYLSN
ncbi:MAG: IS630 family transposase [Rhabdochlamydiaceae bacterium]